MPLSDLVQTLLKKRGVITPEAIAAFLQPEYNALHAAQLLPDMEKAVARTLQAMERRERIAIYADFDCDGIPGAALLASLFKKLHYAEVEVYIPHRELEGRGLHMAAIETLASRGVKLIISVDLGTTACDAVDHASRLGVDVIVSDHHEITGALPHAVAVLNPKRDPYPFRDLCGTGVAFKFAQALLAEGRVRGVPEFLAIAEGWEKWLLDLVAIATVADMVPLHDENRILVYWGLSVLRKSPRKGIRALCAQVRIRQHELTEDDISFSIAPRINAASRMDSPELALQLLLTEDAHEAETLALKLEALNKSRKGIVAAMVRDARKRLTNQPVERVTVLGDTSWRPALLGLVANTLVNDRGGLVCLWGRDGTGKLRGSCRSDGSISVAETLAAARENFEEFGGHAASGGFTLVSEKVHDLQHALNAVATAPGVAETTTHDALIALEEVSFSLLNDVSRLAPFGIGNEKPVFLVGSVRTVAIKRFGKEKNHVEVHLESVRGARARSYDFFRAPEDFSHVPLEGQEARLLATIERDTFRGGLALRIIDLLPAA